MEVRLGGNWTLSTEHAASSYGQPVLRDLTGNVYGPGDVVVAYASWGYLPARRAVARMARGLGDRLDEEQRQLVEAFVRDVESAQPEA